MGGLVVKARLRAVSRTCAGETERRWKMSIRVFSRGVSSGQRSRGDLTVRALLIPAITRFLGDLRFRNLFLITAALFAVNLFVPDMIPFADELLLGLATLVLARWKDRKATPAPANGSAPREVIDLPSNQVKREG
jgi:hypothetical protein